MILKPDKDSANPLKMRPDISFFERYLQPNPALPREGEETETFLPS